MTANSSCTTITSRDRHRPSCLGLGTSPHSALGSIRSRGRFPRSLVPCRVSWGFSSKGTSCRAPSHRNWPGWQEPCASLKSTATSSLERCTKKNSCATGVMLRVFLTSLSLPTLVHQVPAELSALTGVETFHLGTNALTGSLPEGLGDGMVRVASFDFGDQTPPRTLHGGLVGPIPASVEALACRLQSSTAATQCSLAGNAFTESNCAASPCAASKCSACSTGSRGATP